MKREQFTFYRSFYEAISHLPREEQLDVYLAVIRYALDGVEAKKLNNNQMGYYVLIRPNLKTARTRAKKYKDGKEKSEQVPTNCRNKKEIEKEIEIENETENKGFAAFWGRYPRTVGRAEAESAWVCVSEKYGEETIFSGLEKWIASRAWSLEGGRYVPKPAKFLNEEWFLQEPPGEIPQGASGKLGRAEMEALQKMLEDSYEI